MPPFFYGHEMLAKGDSRHLLLSLIGDIYLYDFIIRQRYDENVLAFGDTFARPDGLNGPLSLLAYLQEPEQKGSSIVGMIFAIIIALLIHLFMNATALRSELIKPE